jgi:alkanesulfonate monooxygenase SsuD/methylene tetrahydromethanopterin reductase-like flavin-dependent oxidoreductase (luciferase family)
VAIRRDVYVGADAEEAKSVGDAIVAKGYRGFDPSALVYGSVNQVRDGFAAYAEMGYTDVIVRHITNDQAEVLGSIERLARVRELVRPL